MEVDNTVEQMRSLYSKLDLVEMKRGYDRHTQGIANTRDAIIVPQ